MSRCYEVTVEIDRIPVAKAKQVFEACDEEWSFENDFQWRDFRSLRMLTPEEVDRLGKRSKRLVSLSRTGQDNLCAGVTEQELAERLVRAIWRACGGYVAVKVRATYLDALPPGEEYVYDKEVFKRMKKGVRK